LGERFEFEIPKRIFEIKHNGNGYNNKPDFETEVHLVLSRHEDELCTEILAKEIEELKERGFEVWTVEINNFGEVLSSPRRVKRYVKRW
jgi:hypothetical protein